MMKYFILLSLLFSFSAFGKDVSAHKKENIIVHFRVNYINKKKLIITGTPYTAIAKCILIYDNPLNIKQIPDWFDFEFSNNNNKIPNLPFKLSPYHLEEKTNEYRYCFLVLIEKPVNLSGEYKLTIKKNSNTPKQVKISRDNLSINMVSSYNIEFDYNKIIALAEMNKNTMAENLLFSFFDFSAKYSVQNEMYNFQAIQLAFYVTAKNNNVAAGVNFFNRLRTANWGERLKYSTHIEPFTNALNLPEFKNDTSKLTFEKWIKLNKITVKLFNEGVSKAVEKSE